MKQFFLSHKYFIIIFVFFIILLPQTIGLPAQTDNQAIVTGISVDKKEGNFNVALQLITPQSDLSKNENIEIVEDEGETFFRCIDNLSIKLGKTVGFEHTNIIIIGQSVEGEDIMNILDFLYRNSKITLSTTLLQSNKEAKKILETSAELNNNSSSSLQNNLAYNNKIIETSYVTSIGKFFNDYFSYSKISLVPLIEEPENEEETQKTNESGGSSGGGSQETPQGQTGGSQTSSEAKVEPLIKNNGESVIYKNGRYFSKLSRELTNGFSWLEEETVKGVVKVEDVNDNKFYHNATVSVQVENSKTKVKPIYKNNQLVLKTELKLFCYVGEIVDMHKKSYNLMQSDQSYLSKELEEAVKKKITQTIQNSLNYSKLNNVDVFNFYDKFYKYKKNDLKKVLSNYGENYLQACDIEVDIKIYPYK